MKTKLLKLFTVAGLLTVQSNVSLNAQTVSTVETLTLSPNSYWNGSSKPLGTTFSSGNAVFQNKYDTAYGGYWKSGWAYSNKKDSTTAGYTNMYSARPAVGYNSSANYLVGQQGAKIILNPTAAGKVVNGFYITNSTYAAISMKKGDTFGKKFGGTSADDKDWFKLTVHKWLAGVMTNDSVDFYLADYRFTNNAQDYIVTAWQWVDLTSLGNVDSLKFTLSSSDVGTYGMNTPAYFCMDNFTTANSAVSVDEINLDNTFYSIYPNPATDIVNIDVSKLLDKNVFLNVTDITGKVVYSQKSATSNIISIDLNEYSSGIYFVTIVGDNTFINKKLIVK
jgi:hypothetical protein